MREKDRITRRWVIFAGLIGLGVIGSRLIRIVRKEMK